MLESSGKNLTPFAYAFHSGSDGEPREAEREARLKEPVGEGEIAIREFMQWWFIVRWDKAVGDANKLEDALTLLNKYPEEYVAKEELAKVLGLWKQRLNQRRKSALRS